MGIKKGEFFALQGLSQIIVNPHNRITKTSSNFLDHILTNLKDKLNLSESLVNVICSLTTEKAESMVNLIQMGGEVSEICSEAKLAKAQVIFSGS